MKNTEDIVLSSFPNLLEILVEGRLGEFQRSNLDRGYSATPIGQLQLGVQILQRFIDCNGSILCFYSRLLLSC